MRVLILAPQFPSTIDKVSGTFYLTQARALVRLGAQVQVVAPVPWVPPGFAQLSARWADYAKCPGMYEIDGTLVHRPRIPTHPRNLRFGLTHRAHVWAAEAVARRFHPDVIHGHFAVPSGLAGVMLAKRLGIPAFVTLHGSDVNIAPFWSKATSKRFSRAVSGAIQVIAVSRALAEITFAISGVRPRVLPIGIEVERFRETRRDPRVRNDLGMPSDSFIALFIGHLIKEKGVPELVNALDALDGKILGAFVGQGPLEGMVRGCKHAILYGSRAPSEIPRILSAADVLVLPSHSEGMPTVLVEAGAAMVPVLATPVGGIPELCEAGRGSMLPVSPASAHDIVKGLTILRDAPESAARQAGMLHEYILRDYDSLKNANELLALYRAAPNMVGHGGNTWAPSNE